MKKVIKRLVSVVLSLCLLVSMMMFDPVAKAATKSFVHPGLLHTSADFTRMTQMVNASTQPYLDGWNALVNSTYSNSSWTPRAVATITRGGDGDNIALLYVDAARAYECALRWKISGSTAHGDTAVKILNAWSSTLTSISGTADRYLAAGLQGYQLANAAEIMRGYSGFDVTQMQNMLINVFYKPLNERFLIGNEYGKDHNDACIGNYWANWDLANMASTVAIGIFCDRRDIYDIGIEYFRHGLGNGSIYNAIPMLHPNGLAQWQESGRDQAHTQLGIGLMAVVCEMAWNQGDDLYGWANNRFMRAAEYVAKYNNGSDVPFATYQHGTGTNGTLETQTVISNASRGEVRPIWAMIYNHYNKRKGLSVPNIAERVTQTGTEGGPNGSYPSTFDQLGFGTLLYTRPAGGGSSAVLPNGNIPDGTYRFIGLQSGKAMAGAGTAAGSNVCIITTDNSTSQQWTITHLGGGQYKVINVASGLSLDVVSGNLDNGALIKQYAYNGGDNQRFAFIPVGGGYCRIIPVHSSNKTADVINLSTADGANLQQWLNLLGTNQKWRLEPVTATVRLQSYNFPDRYLRHSNFRAQIDPDVTPAQDSNFKMVSGLAGWQGVSFESVNYPGRFLRVRSNGEVWLDTNDGTDTFKNDATFRRVPGLADAKNYSSFQMWTDSTKYLRHSNYLIYAQSGSGTTFNADATFLEVSP